ncbi:MULTISPECIES: PaaI family thioesterase [unclassified Enterococcus]|uniref:PaaI family thioesterase n=1 Tax=unclassified Enterococcus TaxID=2608891 RepID=UPI001A9267A7|nr:MULTISPECIES: PaaI family thioesterase [unclassified Enterococcus]MBO0462184.1 PaaI family thioesterase [Enterococcus sp. DIV1298c]MBO1299430.1 PaaI family thioesterase [Enterococcus sp. DIV1271a]
MDLLQHLGIETLSVTPEEVQLALTIADTHHQPFGYLHGGISGVLIETACSIGANQHLSAPHFAVGVDLHVQHLNKASSGTLRVVAHPEKIGKNLHFWRATVYLDNDLKIAIGQCTLMVN